MNIYSYKNRKTKSIHILRIVKRSFIRIFLKNKEKMVCNKLRCSLECHLERDANATSRE